MNAASVIGKSSREVLFIAEIDSPINDTFLFEPFNIDVFLMQKQNASYYRMKAFDGSSFPCEIAVSFTSNISSENETVNSIGIFASCILTFSDISIRLEMEDRLRQSEKMDALGQLAGGVAHDFNNMLGSIMGAADLLKMCLEDSVYTKSGNQEALDYINYTNMIIETGQKASVLTKKLLSFSRKSQVMFHQIDLVHVIKESAMLLERCIDKKIHIELDYGHDNLFVLGDQTELENMFLNIGLNARDAMPSGGILTISAHVASLDDTVCVRYGLQSDRNLFVEIICRDSGSGIPLNIIEKIFDPFFTTKGLGKGTGLGLASVKATVVEHGGFILVDSKINEGTVFTIYLPLEQRSNSLQRNDGDSLVALSQKNIVVVEDEEVLRIVLENGLRDMNQNVVSFNNGDDAMEFFSKKQKSVDFVILDMILPGRSGEEILQEIEKRNPHCKVVITTGFMKDSSVSDIISFSCVIDVIKKPYRLYEINRCLAKASS